MGVYINAKNSSAENFVSTSLKRLTMEEGHRPLLRELIMSVGRS